MSDKYILNDAGEPVMEPDLMKWAEWFETSRDKRIVKQELVHGVKVSTVFLGLDHNYGEGLPALWETMVFGGPLDQQQERCGGKRKDAEVMHASMAGRVRSHHP